jgi:two-component system sensor kinase
MNEGPLVSESPREAGEPIPGAPPVGRTPSAKRPLFVLAPVLALLACTVALGFAAWWLEAHRTEMLAAAAGAASVIVAMTIFLLYRQAVARMHEAQERLRAQELLERSEARLRGIVDSAMDAIITVDESQHVVLFNAAAEKMFDCQRVAAIGAPLSRFIPKRFRDAHVEHVAQFGRTGTTSRRMAGMRVVTGLRRNGAEFPIDASISQLAEGGQKFFTVILRDVTERARADEALRESKEELQALASAAHQAREQEQSRIARGLHDELGQSLTALKMLVASLRENVVPRDGVEAQKLDKMDAVLDRTVAATRRIVAALRPLILDDLGLVPAIEWLAEDFTQRNGIPCSLAIDDPELEVTGRHATAIFRIVQEALTNVARHAKAHQVEVSIAKDDSEVAIRVRDDGVGFATDAPREPGSHGLLGMRERAYLLGGTIEVHSAPGRGTAIEVRLPLVEVTQS